MLSFYRYVVAAFRQETLLLFVCENMFLNPVHFQSVSCPIIRYALAKGPVSSVYTLKSAVRKYFSMLCFRYFVPSSNNLMVSQLSICLLAVRWSLGCPFVPKLSIGLLAVHLSPSYPFVSKLSNCLLAFHWPLNCLLVS